MARRWLVVLSVLVLVGAPFGLAGAAPAPGLSFARGAVAALAGTPHIWIADDRGALHWAGDTRALAGHYVNWSDRTEVTYSDLRSNAAVGDPWLSAGLLKDGDAIYLVKWESSANQPTLLHIQSIADVEVFGINGGNYGALVRDRGAWERQYGISAGGLQRGELPSAIPATATPVATARATVAATSTPNGLDYSSKAFVTTKNTYGTWTWVPYWANQVNDPYLLGALQIASTYNAEWRQRIASYLADRNTAISFAALEDGVGGYYLPSRNQIQINLSTRSDSSGVVAALLSHEIYHAVTVPYGTTDAADCIQNETEAFTWQASTWNSLPTGWRSDTSWGRSNDQLVTLWENRKVTNTVLTMPGYQKQCLGRVLPQYDIRGIFSFLPLTTGGWGGEPEFRLRR